MRGQQIELVESRLLGTGPFQFLRQVLDHLRHQPAGPHDPGPGADEHRVDVTQPAVHPDQICPVTEVPSQDATQLRHPAVPHKLGAQGLGAQPIAQIPGCEQHAPAAQPAVHPLPRLLGDIDPGAARGGEPVGVGQDPGQARGLDGGQIGQHGEGVVGQRLGAGGCQAGDREHTVEQPAQTRIGGVAGSDDACRGHRVEPKQVPVRPRRRRPVLVTSGQHTERPDRGHRSRGLAEKVDDRCPSLVRQRAAEQIDDRVGPVELDHALRVHPPRVPARGRQHPLRHGLLGRVGDAQRRQGVRRVGMVHTPQARSIDEPEPPQHGDRQAHLHLADVSEQLVRRAVPRGQPFEQLDRVPLAPPVPPVDDHRGDVAVVHLLDVEGQLQPPGGRRLVPQQGIHRGGLPRLDPPDDRDTHRLIPAQHHPPHHREQVRQLVGRPAVRTWVLGREPVDQSVEHVTVDSAAHGIRHTAHRPPPDLIKHWTRSTAWPRQRDPAQPAAPRSVRRTRRRAGAWLLCPAFQSTDDGWCAMVSTRRG